MEEVSQIILDPKALNLIGAGLVVIGAGFGIGRIGAVDNFLVFLVLLPNLVEEVSELLLDEPLADLHQTLFHEVEVFVIGVVLLADQKLDFRSLLK